MPSNGRPDEPAKAPPTPLADEQETANPLPEKDYTKGEPPPGQDKANDADVQGS